ncbi:MAG TPA: class 1 isoprenoid biosynthesis enzyme [Terracidiphilus sp.]|jgi:hypothetical protein
MESLATPAWVTPSVNRAMDLWALSAGAWSGTGPVYTPPQQKQREKAYDRAIDGVRRTCRKRAPDAEDRLTRSFAQFGAEALDLGPDAVDLLTHGFLPVGKSLARWAHRFDPTLSQADITQAARNAWTACGMQPLFGAPMRLTPSILGYSLLYPYSDNYLDQCAVTRDDKVRFNRRFRARLRGDALRAANPHELSVWEMVGLIESEFPRRLFPFVFDALLAIHAAQEESMRQLDERGRMDVSELLRISCAKGGSSVLADAFLVRGTLNAEESEFAFLWGVLLQLGDDLQDIHEDLARGSDTLFIRAIRAGRPLDPLIEQLLNFSEMAGARMDALPHGSATQKSLLRMSWRSLILMAVAQAPTCFTPAFLQRMDSHSPFRFHFLRKRKEKLASDRGLFNRIFDILLKSDDHTASHLPNPMHPMRNPTHVLCS